MRLSLRSLTLTLVAALLAGLALLPAAQPAAAGVVPSTITVTTTAIENTDGNGCSLYEALQASFNGAPYHQCSAGDSDNLIVFGGSAAAGTISMPVGPGSLDLPMINRSVTITGPVIISGGGAQGDLHIFRIAPGGTLNLANLALKDAHSSGGGAAILDTNRGTINALGVAFINNVADGDGGAINSNGAVNIVGGSFMGNQALGLMPDKSNNPGTGYGGAIHVDGYETLKLVLTNFSGNLADKGGGAVHYSGKSADVSDTVFSGNLVNGTGSDSSAPKGGGAFYADSDVTVTFTRSAFSGNLTPTSNGGALYTAISATGVISTTSFNGNIAASPGNSGMGGAIYNAGANLSIAQALFLNNAVALGNGGALANDRHGSASIANSTFTANAALEGNGGAIYNSNTQQGGPASSVVARNATFDANAAINSGGHGGTLFNDAGHSLTIGNTIVAGSAGDNCTGAIGSLGHNLDSASSCGLGLASSNQDPKLDPPFFNGGPLAALLTQKLQPGSPAIDAGDAGICAAEPVGKIDQRGDPRPKNGDSQGAAICDIGAFESDPLVPGYGSTPVEGSGIAFGSAVINGGTAEALLQIFETGNTTLQVGSPQLSGLNVADFAVGAPSPFPLSIADGGAARTISLTCAPKAAGLRTATLTLSTNDPNLPQVSYFLTCNGTTVPKPAFGSKPAAPGPIDLGSALVGGTVSASFTISSTGDADLHLGLSDPALAGANPTDFKLVNSPTPTLAPEASQGLQLQCKPTALGIRTATLTLTTDEPSRPTVSFNLACSGEPPPPPILDEPGQGAGGTGMTGAYGVAISPDGQNVYVTGASAKAVKAFKRDAVTGTLTAIQSFSAVALDSLDGARLLAASPDGKHLYIASQFGGLGGTGALVVLNRDTTTGQLSIRQESTAGGEAGLNGAYGVAISSDGRFVYISGASTSASTGSVVVYSRDAGTGLLNKVETITSADLFGAHGLALSPDGTSLYVTAHAAASTNSGKLVVYKRNAGDGKLGHIQTRSECDSLICFIGGNGLDGLGGAFQVAVSPDGQFVYTASVYDGAVMVFKRNALDGSVARVRTYKDGVSGLNGLGRASGVAISPDGRFLFATAATDKAVSVFERDLASGLLTFRQLVQRNPLVGGPALPPLDGARDIAATPDGTTVYATASADNAVVALHTANPSPALTSLAPSSAEAGAAGFTLAVRGEGFVPGATIIWDGAALPTTYVNNTKLTAGIGAGKLGAAGQADVHVVNPTPGGGLSNTLAFTISAPGQNPVPSIDTIAPGSAPAGGAAFTLTINGANFIAGSQVRWNGAGRATSFVSASQLTAQITAADLAAAGPAGVTVFNPGPGGGLSNAAEFTVAAPGENPLPTISGISPSKQMTDLATASQITVEISGANFMADSLAQWNGANRPTSFVSATKLRMLVSAADLALGGQGSVTVTNPGPGGGVSNTATFTIITIKMRLYMPLAR